MDDVQSRAEETHVSPQKTTRIALVRTLAGAYLFLALIDFFGWLSGGLPTLSSISLYNLFSWFFYLVGILALLGVLTRRSFLGGTAWRTLLLGYTLFRYLELKVFGGALVEGDLPLNVYRIARYCFIAFPPALAMLLLGFMHRPSRPEVDSNALVKTSLRSSSSRWSDNLLP